MLSDSRDTGGPDNLLSGRETQEAQGAFQIFYGIMPDNNFK